MYESFYGLREKPFSIAPDPAYLYQSAIHQEALANLRYGIREGKGFVVLTGEVGTGKTLILHALLESLGPEVRSAYIFYPKISFEHLLRLILNEFEQPIESTAAGDLLIQLNDYLIERFRNSESTVLIIDEAQDLDADLLENIRLLSNLETSKSKLLTIILVGQPELHHKLSQPDLRQLRQRVVVRFHMMPLDKSEVKGYIQHRLRMAGAVNLNLFNDRAVSRIAAYSEGVPRLINILCDNALLLGYAEEEQVIGGAIIDEVIGDLEGGALATAPGRLEREARGPRRRKRLTPVFLVTLAVVMALVVGAFGGPHLMDWMRTDRPSPTSEGSVDSARVVGTADAANPVEPAVPVPLVENHGEKPPIIEDEGGSAKGIANSDHSIAPVTGGATEPELILAPHPVETLAVALAPPTATPAPPTPQPTDTPTLTATPTATATATPEPTATPAPAGAVTEDATLAERLLPPVEERVPTPGTAATPQVASATNEAIPVMVLTQSQAQETPGAEMAVQVSCFVNRERARECVRMVRRLGAEPVMAQEVLDDHGVSWVRVFAVGFDDEESRGTFLRKALEIAEIRAADPFRVYITRLRPGDGETGS